MCRPRRGNGLIKRERKLWYRALQERTIISRVGESVPKMESPSVSLTFSNVAEDTRMCCCPVVDIVNLEKSLKKKCEVRNDGCSLIVTSRLGRNPGR